MKTMWLCFVVGLLDCGWFNFRIGINQLRFLIPLVGSYSEKDDQVKKFD